MTDENLQLESRISILEQKIVSEGESPVVISLDNYNAAHDKLKDISEPITSNEVKELEDQHLVSTYQTKSLVTGKSLSYPEISEREKSF